MESDELPAGWAMATLGDALDQIIGGGTPSKSVPEYFEGTIPLMTVKDMKVSRPLETGFNISEEALQDSSAKIVPADTVIIATRMGLGKVVRPKMDTAINQDLKALFPSEALEKSYLEWWLHSVARKIEAMGTGTTVKGVRLNEVKALDIPLAPLAEQQRIVEKIETLFAELDKGEEALREVQKLLARYRQSVLKAAVTGALTADWRAANGPAKETGEDLLTRLLEERRATWQGRGKYKEPVEPEIEGLPELPSGWIWASLSQLTHIKGGVTVDKKREPTDPVTLPYLRVANVQNGFLNLEEIKEITVDRSKADACLLQPHDILLNEGGDRDKLGRGWVWDGEITPCIHQNHVYRARPVIPELSSHFISYYANAFGQPFFMAKGTQSVNLASISLTAISGLPIPLPPLDEQQELVAIIEEKVAQIENGLRACESEFARAKALRQSILKDAFSGKLVPQDPSDEPAEKLLERIRATREAAPNAKRKTKMKA